MESDKKNETEDMHMDIDDVMECDLLKSIENIRLTDATNM